MGIPFYRRSAVGESLASLYTHAESNLSDRVLSEVEKDSFNALIDKGRYTKLLLWKTICSNPGRFDEVFYNNVSKVGSLSRDLHSHHLISDGWFPNLDDYLWSF